MANDVDERSKQHKKITERELLRISAITGISYSTVVQIMKECKLGWCAGAKRSPSI